MTKKAIAIEIPEWATDYYYKYNEEKGTFDYYVYYCEEGKVTRDELIHSVKQSKFEKDLGVIGNHIIFLKK